MNPLHVNVYDVDSKLHQTHRCACTVDECLPPDDPEHWDAVCDLLATGRHWTGGGAAPLVLLVRAG